MRWKVDGGSHLGREAGQRDALRDQWHLVRGIKTVRVSAGHVERDVEGVLGEVRRRVRDLLGVAESESLTDSPLDEPVQPHEPESPLGTVLGGMLGQAEALREVLQGEVDGLRAGLASPPLTEDVVGTVDEGVAADSADWTERAAVVAAQVRMALLAAEVGGSARAAERKSQCLIAQACRTVLPVHHEAFVEHVLRRAGLARGRRPRP